MQSPVTRSSFRRPLNGGSKSDVLRIMSVDMTYIMVHVYPCREKPSNDLCFSVQGNL